VELRASELAMILDGIDMTKLKRVPRYERVTAARERTEDLERTSGGNREKVAI
jgi:hypothetical protein